VGTGQQLCRVKTELAAAWLAVCTIFEFPNTAQVDLNVWDKVQAYLELASACEQQLHGLQAVEGADMLVATPQLLFHYVDLSRQYCQALGTATGRHMVLMPCVVHCLIVQPTLPGHSVSLLPPCTLHVGFLLPLTHLWPSHLLTNSILLHRLASLTTTSWRRRHWSTGPR